MGRAPRAEPLHSLSTSNIMTLDIRPPATIALTMATLAFSAPLHAAETPPPAAGPFLGLSVQQTQIDPTDDRPRRDATGIDLSIGYRLDERIAVVLSTAGATLHRVGDADVRLGHLDALLRVDLPGAGAWQPYVGAGLTRRTARLDALAPATPARRHAAWGPTLAVGVGYRVAPGWSVGAGLKHTLGRLPDHGGTTRAAAPSTRLAIGLEWAPGG